MEILSQTSSEIRSTQIPEFKSPTPAPIPELELNDLYCVLQMNQYDSFMALELAKRIRDAGRLDEALRLHRSILKIDYRFETVHALAQVEYACDRIDDAFQHLQEALLIAPEVSDEFFDVFKTMGNIFVRRGDFDSAEDSYNRAFRLRPDSDVLCVNFGTLMIQRADWDGAAVSFRKALGVNPANDKAWVGLAICHRTKGDLDLAWGNVEAALEYNPLNEVALGLALDWGAQEGREFRALELIRAFLVAGGWNEKFSLAFAWLSWRRGDSAIACLELERLLAVHPDNATALQLAHDIRRTD